MSFLRLTRGDALAGLAALALLFAMAMDWYSTKQGEEARRLERISEPEGALAGEAERRVQEQARAVAEREERNAWQGDQALDDVLLGVLLACVVLALGAAALRAAGRRFAPPLSPSGLTALAGLAAATLVTYRMFDEPGLDAGTTIRPGAPLALAALGLIVLGAAAALRREHAGTAWKELPPPPEPEGPGSREADSASPVAWPRRRRSAGHRP